MTTAPDISTDTIPEQSEAPTIYATAQPAPASPRHAWSFTDLLLLGLVGLLTVAAGAATIREQAHRAARDRVAKNFTAGAAAFRSYIEQNGSAPPTGNTGEVPKGMASFFGSLDWSVPSPVGGAFRWVAANETDPKPDTVPTIRGGVITLTAFPPGLPLTLSAEDLLVIDRQIDDGNLATGNFRTGFNGWPVLSVQVSP